MADHVSSTTATPEQKTAAIEMVLRRHGALTDGFVEDFTEHADDAWVTANGAKMVMLRKLEAHFARGSRPVSQHAGTERRIGPGPGDPSPPCGAGERLRHPQRDRMHAVLLHRLHDHRCRTGLV